MRKFWQRFRRNKFALIGLCILTAFILAAVFAPLLAPHDPNRANLRMRNQPPSRNIPLAPTIWAGTSFQAALRR